LSEGAVTKLVFQFVTAPFPLSKEG
jgi:hypothetical protein